MNTNIMTQKINIKKIILVISSIIFVTAAIGLLTNNFLKTSPSTRDRYCKYTGGEVIFPAMQWNCIYDPNDFRTKIN